MNIAPFGPKNTKPKMSTKYPDIPDEEGSRDHNFPAVHPLTAKLGFHNVKTKMENKLNASP